MDFSVSLMTNERTDNIVFLPSSVRCFLEAGDSSTSVGRAVFLSSLAVDFAMVKKLDEIFELMRML